MSAQVDDAMPELSSIAAQWMAIIWSTLYVPTLPV